MGNYEIFERVKMSPTHLLLGATVVFFTAYVLLHTFFLRRIAPDAPLEVRANYPLTGAWGFWNRRWEFFQKACARSSTGNFSFHAGSHHLVGLSGGKSRQIFFDSRDLGFAEGYAVLFGSAPRLEQYDEAGVREEASNYFSRRLAYLLKNEQFRKKLPILKSDVQEAIEAMRNEPNGITDPFESIYRIVFRLTIRMVGAEDIANDPVLLEQTLKYFEMIDASATATSVMFPKFPSPAILKRTYAGARLYMMVEKIVKGRAKSGEKQDDALQYLIDQGDRMHKIIEFIIGSLFAGLLNSGINAAWVLCYLATDEEWLAKVREEVRTTSAKYARNPDAPLYHQLDDVPLEAWETEFPMIDLCLKDSIRLNLVGTAFRKNVSGKAVPTGSKGEVIPPEAFVTYPIGDVHLNPDIYPNPTKWDPSRYLPEKAEDKKAAYAYLGWGAGRHPCLGMRFAKLEQNIITAYFIASFDFTLQNEKGVTLTEAPLVNLNGHAAAKPSVRQFLKLRPLEK